jgi:hypothetical protein
MLMQVKMSTAETHVGRYLAHGKTQEFRKSKTAAEYTTKGELVEFIVASMHRRPGVDIEANVKLPPFDELEAPKSEH